MNLYELVRYIQRSKNYNDNFSASSNQKLSATDQMDIDISSGVVTLDNVGVAIALSTSGNIVAGTLYVIPGVATSFYGGTEIVLTGLNTTNFSKQGWGLFYNPKYTVYSVWDPTQEYSVGTKIIYGGTVWINTSGNVGSVNDILTLSSGDWTVIPYNNTDYNEAYDFIEYDFDDDFIITRGEAKNNNIVSCSYAASIWWFCSVNPIRVFRWGHDYDGTNGVINCNIRDSYFNCLNIIYGYISEVTMTQFSNFSMLQLTNSSYIDTIEISNYSNIDNLTLSGSNISNITIMDDSSISNLALLNSGISGIELMCNSWMDSISINNATIYNVLIMNDSVIYNTTIESGSNINYINLYDDSYIGELQLTNSSQLYQLDITKSEIWSVTLDTNSKMWNLTLNNAYLYDINATANYYFNNSDITGSSKTIPGTITGGQEEASTYKYNTIIYQFSVNTGDLAEGPVILPPLFVPPGFFVENALIESIGMSDGGSGAQLTFGIANDGPSCILNSAYNSLTGIQQLTIATIPPVKASALQPLVMTLDIGGVISGVMNIELTLKNINFSYDNY